MKKRFKKKKKVVQIARRGRYRRYTRYVTRAARRGYRSRKGLLGGSLGNVFWGAAAGAVSNMIPQFLGGWTNPILFGAGGYLLKKPALLTVAGYEAGKQLAGGFLGGGGSDSGGGWL